MANLTAALEKERKRICKIAEDAGLDFFETIFELINYEQMNQVAAYGGFPVRYPHWRFGMEYEQLAKGYEYGLSKIYELVINNDPCYAYLMEGNEFVDQKLVMAHVYGHCDFFKNNQWFAPTNRKMMDVMANHGTRVRRYMDRHGIDVVEDFIDVCLSLENLIDRHGPYRSTQGGRVGERDFGSREDGGSRFKVQRDYMEKFINPPEVMAEEARLRLEKAKFERRHFPSEPVRDVLEFLIQYAPLDSWQQDVMSIIREEAYYFAPQGMTKIMNEGWASYWHSRLMTEKIASDAEIVDFADRHSGTMAMSPTGFNPYKVGIELFRDIEERWNKGRYGKEWEENQDMNARKNWNTQEGRGREKIFQVRRNYNDVTFIDEYLTEDFCIQNRMFVYKFNKRTGRFEVDTRDFKAIKAKLLFQLTNFGQPILNVVDANFENKGELLLAHMYEGVEMQPDHMQATMKNLFLIWSRPVNVATVLDNERRIVKYDGQDFQTMLLSDLPVGDGNDEKSKK